MKRFRQSIAIVLTLCMLLPLFQTVASAKETDLSELTAFVFGGDTLTVIPGTDTGYEIIGINQAGEEYTVGGELSLSVDNTEQGYAVYTNTAAYRLCVAIKKSGGSYVFRGVGNDMSITVAKGATEPTNLYLDGLTLSSSFTAPITVKKDSGSCVNIIAVEGTENQLSDAARNNADLYGDPTEDGGDGSNTAYAESAVIKAKSGARLHLCGSGKLTLCCNSKNAVKVAEKGKLTISDLTLCVTSVNHGISCDNLLDIRSGNITVTAQGDGIRSDPDTVDADNGCAGTVHINSGTVTVTAGGDCIQAAQDLTVDSGVLTLTAGGGYNSKTFNENTMSCKGLKASAGSDETADTSDATNTITVNGGTFIIDTADDAIHSDACIVIKGGTFSLKTGDDGVHADASLTLGQEGDDDDLINLKVLTCYEGLEAGNVYLYSGNYSVVGTDDGINAAGDSSDSTFQPGRGPGRFVGRTTSGSKTADYSINISGGNVFVNVSGDGLDSNGSLNLTGGSITVWGQQAGGDNAPLDCDGTLTINGATVFAAGSRQMATTPSGGSQRYVRYSGNTAVSAGKTVNVLQNGTVVFQTIAPKQVNYILYSSPDVSTGWSITVDSSAVTEQTEKTYDCSVSGHIYDSGFISSYPTCTKSGTKTRTCIKCGKTSAETVAEYGHEYVNGICALCGAAEESETANYTVYFDTDDGCTVTTYLTQDTEYPYETDASSAYARNSDTGEMDTSGDGQTNFRIVLQDGYTLQSIAVTDGTENYKNLKTVEEETLLYRLTKITGDITVTVTTQPPVQEKDPCEGYTDIDRDGWYHSAADFVIQKGIMGSTNTNTLTFEASTCCSRAMIVCILYRLAGSPKVEYSPVFSDVKEGKWYTDAIIWAAENGIVRGYTDGTFGPNDNITREQIAVILKGYAAACGKDTSNTAALTEFADCETVTWSRQAVCWAVAEGLISGKVQNGKTLLAPESNASRAETAAILMRFIQNVMET